MIHLRPGVGGDADCSGTTKCVLCSRTAEVGPIVPLLTTAACGLRPRPCPRLQDLAVVSAKRECREGNWDPVASCERNDQPNAGRFLLFKQKKLGLSSSQLSLTTRKNVSVSPGTELGGFGLLWNGEKVGLKLGSSCGVPQGSLEEAAMGQVAMSALGSSRACSPRPSPPTVHCSSQCPPIVRTANVLCARSLPSPWSSRPLRSDLGPWARGLYWGRRAYRSAVSPTLCVLIAGPVRPAPRWTVVGP